MRSLNEFVRANGKVLIGSVALALVLVAMVQDLVVSDGNHPTTETPEATAAKTESLFLAGYRNRTIAIDKTFTGADVLSYFKGLIAGESARSGRSTMSQEERRAIKSLSLLLAEASGKRVDGWLDYCLRWAEAVLEGWDESGRIRYSVRRFYRVGLECWTTRTMEHAAIAVEFKNGVKFFLDDAILGRVSTGSSHIWGPSDLPSTFHPMTEFAREEPKR